MMRRAIQTGLLVILLMGISAHAGKVIDAILVTINGTPLMQSDLESTLRFESLVQQRSPDTPVETKPVLDRLIDQELLRQQMQGDFKVPDKEINDRLADLRGQFEAAKTDAGWMDVLGTYGLTQAEVRERIETQLQILHFVDLRLRPNVVVDNDAVAAYYRDSLVPKAKQVNATVEPLEELAPKIRELLVQQKMDTLLTAWLANLRSQSQIHLTRPSESSVSSQSNRTPTVPAEVGIGAR